MLGTCTVPREYSKSTFFFVLGFGRRDALLEAMTIQTHASQTKKKPLICTYTSTYKYIQA